MIIEGQILLLTFKKYEKKHLVISFKEIGKVWQSIIFQVERKGQINYIVNGQVDNNSSYEFYIKRDVMKEISLDYVVETKGKGDIVKMATKRKADLVKSINFRGLNTHGCKVSIISTRKQVKNVGAHKPKDRDYFQVSIGSEDGTW